MILTFQSRARIFGGIAGLAAIWLGSEIAGGNFFWPTLCAGVAAIFLFGRLQPLPLATVFLGVAVFGYAVGQRGFAQQSLVANLPLLPAEFVLLGAGCIFLVQAAWRRELPIRRDSLNLLLLLWAGVGLARMYFDLRAFGVTALRDFATVYYVAFFFLGQEAARDEASRRFLIRCLLIAPPVVLMLYPFYLRAPDFFIRWFAVRGVPIVLYKGDLVGTTLAFGAVLFFVHYERQRRIILLATSLALILGAIATDNRASLVGLGVATLWLTLAGRWRFAAIQMCAGIVGVALILAAAYAANIPWQKTPVYGLYEKVISIVDPMGVRTYESEESVSKGDNNLFRAVWWRAVATETIEENPAIGLGFGHDLAENFVREYYPDPASEFTTRSPHNILLTVFARMGLAGLLPFLAAIVVMARRTYRATRDRTTDAAALWCAVWVILVSACFGVVLEGPMGAVVFWTALGIANAASSPSAEPAPAPHLPDAAPMDQLASTS